MEDIRKFYEKVLSLCVCVGAFAAAVAEQCNKIAKIIICWHAVNSIFHDNTKKNQQPQFIKSS